MGAMLTTVIYNNTDFPLEIRKCSKLDKQGTWHLPDRVEPHKQLCMRSRKFNFNWSDTSITRFIKFSCNGVCFAILTPQDFINNRRFNVEMDDQKIPFLTTIKLSTVSGNISDRRTEEPLLP
ncbi:unnamed protein product [Trifolium pratense]|uniref:Uncharacterized protein n=1 Tax=Trifolium pratense TaxID=57577 RepID=A0ACB0M2Q6_TRIPR|nr:unnamed protein product [Trifolium pratense]